MRKRAFFLFLLLLLSAQASPADDLGKALLKSRNFALTGQVTVTVYFPPRPQPTGQLNKLPPMPFRPQLLTRNFNVVQAGTVEVAGRDALRYDLTPKVGDAGRWTLWIDTAWNVPLGFEERRVTGEVARRAQFTQVAGPPQKLAAPVPPTPPGLRAAVVSALPGVQFPSGFAPVGLKARAKMGYVVTLSDGANLLVLTTAARPVEAAPGVASRQIGRRAVWLVGNLPSDALNKALAGIRQVKEEALASFLETK